MTGYLTCPKSRLEISRLKTGWIMVEMFTPIVQFISYIYKSYKIYAIVAALNLACYVKGAKQNVFKQTIHINSQNSNQLHTSSLDRL